jgi:PKHD-type hydroxylase
MPPSAEQADWQDGRTTAGFLAAQVKNNLQLPLDSATGKRWAV